MELDTFAYTIGIMELLIGLPLLFYSKQAMKWFDAFLKDDTSVRLLGTLLAILGALVLIDGYEVSLDPEGLIRLVAWLCMLKGIMLTWWPKTAMQMKKNWFKGDTMATLGGTLGVAIGCLLMYGGSIL